MDEQTSGLHSRAEKLLQERRNAISGLDEAAAEVEAARANLAAAERKMGDAVTVAKSAGWTPGELRHLGVALPTTRPRKNSPRARKRSAPASRTGGAGETSPV